MAGYEGELRRYAVSSVFSSLNITLGGARAPLASAPSAVALIGRGLSIVLIEDGTLLAGFWETSQKFFEARGYKNITAGARRSLLVV